MLKEKRKVMKKTIVILYIVLCPFVLSAQVWWGASVGLGHEQPYTNLPAFDLNTQDANNQLVPLFLSSEGEYMWSDNAFAFSAVNGEIKPSVAMEKVKAGKTLREAYMGDNSTNNYENYNTYYNNKSRSDIYNYAVASFLSDLYQGVPVAFSSSSSIPSSMSHIAKTYCWSILDRLTRLDEVWS